MDAWKRFPGLLREDLKSKLGFVAASWYVLGMFCLLFSMKKAVPAGEIRSFYVGAGNTSFFLSAILFGVIMGAGAFRFLYVQSKADLYFGLPFTRSQLFTAGILNNFFIFSVPLVLCRFLFFKISLSMGYCEYEDNIFCVWMGCLVLMVGFLFVMNLSMLAFFLAQNTGYRIGLLALLMLGPDAGIRLSEKMLEALSPSFYRSEFLDLLKRYVPPLSLLENAAGVKEYVDGVNWKAGDHLSYLLVMIGGTGILLCINLIIFNIRPVERKSGMFTFRFVEYLVRYSCGILAALWFTGGLKVFSGGGNPVVVMMISLVMGVPVIHGLLNMVIAFDAKKFFTGKWNLLAEFLVMAVALGGFLFWGKMGSQIPKERETVSMAIALTDLGSGDDSSQVLENMCLTGEELSRAYDWLELITGYESNSAPLVEERTYEALVKYELQNGRTKYFKYRFPGSGLEGFGEVFDQEGFKRGTYEAFRMDSLKYYEVRWTNGLENYTLDLDEEERRDFLKAYQQDLEELTFEEVCRQIPVGRLTFASAKNQGDVSGLLYPGYDKTLTYLSQLNINTDKKVSDYELTQIVVDKYMSTEGFLYDVRYLESQKTITDQIKMTEMSLNLFPEELWIDRLQDHVGRDMEYFVTYRDSAGKTVKKVKCLALGKE